MEIVMLQLLGWAVILLVAYLFRFIPFGMALTTTKDAGELSLGGGGILYAREVQSSGVDLGTPDTNHSLGWIEDSETSDNTAVVDRFDESGALVNSLDDKRTITHKATLMQTSAAYMKIVNDVRGKFYRIYYQDKKDGNGKVKEILFAICKITPNMTLARKSGSGTVIPVEIKVLKNAALVAVVNANLPTEKITAGAMDVAAGAYYFVVETVAP